MDDKKPKTLGGQIASPDNYSIKKMPGLAGVGGVHLGSGLPPGIAGAGKEPGVQGKQIDFNKLKSKLENFKKKVLKKFSFTVSLSILPGNAAVMFEDEEGLPEEVVKTGPTHLMLIIPEEQYKNLSKIRPEVVKFAQESKENLWVHIKTPVDLWNYGLDSKFDFVDAISAGFPLYDNGFLGSLRVANIHKTLVLRKFEKYVASYVIGGSLVRGTADKTSDVDTFVIIDDTDVKRMPRLELLEKLRGIIYDYIREASALAGVKNVLNVQVYLLTDFWQSVKDAQPVMFTFIRDGVPMYDRGTFIPWKLLLRMGKIKPSPEAIDLYMKQGDQTEEFVKRRLMDGMIDVYWGVVTPTQAMMMLAGEAPPVPKTLVADVKKVLVDREKLMSMKDLKVLEKLVKLYKAYEHGTLKEIPGGEIDSLLKASLEYNKTLKSMRKKIEKKMQEKTAEEIYEEVFKLLKGVLGNKSQTVLIKEFESELVKKGKIRPRLLKVLKELVNAKSKIKSGKLSQKESDAVKRDVGDLIDSLVEYAQRVDLDSSKKGTMQMSYKGKKAELVLLGKNNFVIEGANIRKIEGKSLKASSKEEFEKAFNDAKGKISTQISGEVFSVLKKELGNFEVSF